MEAAEAGRSRAPPLRAPAADPPEAGLFRGAPRVRPARPRRPRVPVPPPPQGRAIRPLRRRRAAQRLPDRLQTGLPRAERIPTVPSSATHPPTDRDRPIVPLASTTRGRTVGEADPRATSTATRVISPAGPRGTPPRISRPGVARAASRFPCSRDHPPPRDRDQALRGPRARSIACPAPIGREARIPASSRTRIGADCSPLPSTGERSWTATGRRAARLRLREVGRRPTRPRAPTFHASAESSHGSPLRLPRRAARSVLLEEPEAASAPLPRRGPEAVRRLRPGRESALAPPN